MKLIYRLNSLQDPTQPHTLLTRALVSGIILFANAVLYGFFGVIAAVVLYLIGIKLLGIVKDWLLLSLVLTLIFGFWRSLSMLADSWRNYGHCDQSVDGRHRQGSGVHRGRLCDLSSAQ